MLMSISTNGEKANLFPGHYASCYKRVHLAKSDNLDTLGLCKYPLLSHVLVYEIFNDMDKLPVGYTIDHLDNDGLNNKLNNLELVTKSENLKRRWDRRGHKHSELYKELFANAVKEAHKAGHYKDHLKKLHMSMRKENKGE